MKKLLDPLSGTNKIQIARLIHLYLESTEVMSGINAAHIYQISAFKLWDAQKQSLYRMNVGSDGVDLRRDLREFASEARVRPEAECCHCTQHCRVDDVGQWLEAKSAENAGR